MPVKNVLYMSGSLGLGHVTRDLAIARELRTQHPELNLCWLAASPADQLIKEAGEHLLPEAADLADENAVAEQAARGASLSLIRYVGRARTEWARNVEVLTRVTRQRQFDLIIGDDDLRGSPSLQGEPTAQDLSIRDDLRFRRSGFRVWESSSFPLKAIANKRSR